MVPKEFEDVDRNLVIVPDPVSFDDLLAPLVAARRPNEVPGSKQVIEGYTRGRVHKVDSYLSSDLRTAFRGFPVVMYSTIFINCSFCTWTITSRLETCFERAQTLFWRNVRSSSSVSRRLSSFDSWRTSLLRAVLTMEICLSARMNALVLTNPLLLKEGFCLGAMITTPQSI